MLNGLDPVNKPNAHFDAACTWVKQHVSTWSAWIPPPPVGYVRYRAKSLDGWSALVATIAAITIAVALANMALIYEHQANKQLRFASPFLLSMATAASTLFSIALMLPLFVVNPATCVSAIYFACVGILFWQVALFARAWRIFVIASNRRFSILIMGRLVLIRGTASQIACVLALLAATVVLLLMPWTLGGAPWEPRRVDNMYSPSLFNVVCPVGPNFTALLPVIALHTLLGTVAIGLAVATRKVATITNDSRQVLVSSATLMCSLILSLLIWVADPNPASFSWLVPMALGNFVMLLYGPVFPVAVVCLGVWQQTHQSGTLMSVLTSKQVRSKRAPSIFSGRLSGAKSSTSQGQQQQRGAITQMLDADETASTWAVRTPLLMENTGTLRSSHQNRAPKLVGDDIVRSLQLSKNVQATVHARSSQPPQCKMVLARVAVDLLVHLVPVRNCAHVWTPWTLAKVLIVPSMQLVSILPESNADPWSCFVRKDQLVVAMKTNASGLVSIFIDRKRTYDIQFKEELEATLWIKNFDEVLLGK
ncbi:hypothetical protein BC828DRAFT_390959 [Blastocladiella britannica]|nr:hypothetical protein BC828DRAFT_390959 [Blastocladiella britannica]